MSGHSKWAQIKRQKGVADVKKGQIFTKLAKAITIAVRDGGGIADPNSNFKLRLSIDKARAENMPKENIERAIEKGSGGADKSGFEEALYEGFGPEGVAVIVEAVTDNKQRTITEVKNVFDKNGGALASQGAVSYLFAQKGQIIVHKDNKSYDDIFMLAADSGAEDIEDAGQDIFVYTKIQDLKRVKDSLTEKGLRVDEAELIRKPLNTVQIIDRAKAEKILSFMDKLEGLDDVQKVYSNFDISYNLLSELKTA